MHRITKLLVLLALAFAVLVHSTVAIAQSVPSADELEYLQWFIGVQNDILHLLSSNKLWIDSAISTYPDTPDNVLRSGRHLRNAWVGLVLEIAAKEPPGKYEAFHSEFARVVGLAAESTAAVYDGVRMGDAIRVSEGVALQQRTEEALNHAFELMAAGSVGISTRPVAPVPSTTMQGGTAAEPAPDLDLGANAGAAPMPSDTPTDGQPLPDYLVDIALGTALSGSPGTIGLLLLALLMVLNELVSNLDGEWPAIKRFLNIAMAPLLIAFVLIVVIRVLDIPGKLEALRFTVVIR